MKKELKKIIKATVFVAGAVILFGSFVIGYAEGSKETQVSVVDNETKTKNKYFTNIVVEEGDSLWSIAEEYMDEEHYESIYEYIDELKKMNNLKSDTIYAGQNLVVTYFK